MTSRVNAASGSALRSSATPRSERVLELALKACGYLSIFTTVGIVAVLANESVVFFREVSFTEFLGDTQWTPLFADQHFGIWPLVSGTFLTTAIAMAFALPFGLLAAVYLSEFAPPRVRGLVKPALEVLAGIPTIVYGYFALVFLTPILQRWIPGLAGFNALSPGLIMGVMIVPMVSSLSEDALYAVPNSLREGALGLGATRLMTVFRIVLPTARSGVGAAVILSTARAIGETMIVTIAAGQQPRLTLDPRVPIETMTAYIVQVSLGDVPAGSLEYRTVFVVGAALFVITFIANGIGQRLSRRRPS